MERPLVIDRTGKHAAGFGKKGRTFGRALPLADVARDLRRADDGPVWAADR
jgi:hypothetical protein